MTSLHYSKSLATAADAERPLCFSVRLVHARSSKILPASPMPPQSWSQPLSLLFLCKLQPVLQNLQLVSTNPGCNRNTFRSWVTATTGKKHQRFFPCNSIVCLWEICNNIFKLRISKLSALLIVVMHHTWPHVLKWDCFVYLSALNVPWLDPRAEQALRLLPLWQLSERLPLFIICCSSSKCYPDSPPQRFCINSFMV